jgi:hypothetical protein
MDGVAGRGRCTASEVVGVGVSLGPSDGSP